MKIRASKVYLPQDSAFPFMGLDARSPATAIAPAYSPAVKNVMFEENIVKKRAGYRELGTQPESTNPVIGLVEFETSAGVKHLVRIGTAAHYRYDVSSLTYVNIMPQWEITAVDTADNKFTIQPGEDVEDYFTSGRTFVVEGSTGNDGSYTVKSYTWSSPNAVIEVNENVSDSTADGSVVYQWSGDEDDWVDWVIGTDKNGRFLFLTNGKDMVLKWDGTGNMEKFDPDISGFQTCRAIAIYKDYMFLGNVQASSAEPQTVYWSDTSDFESFQTGNTGSNLMPFLEGGIQKMVPLGDSLIVYSAESIARVSHVGGAALFSFDRVVDWTGLLSGRTIVSVGTMHMFASDSNILAFDGSRALVPLGRMIEDEIRNSVSKTYSDRSFGFFDSANRRVYWVLAGENNQSSVFMLDWSLASVQNLVWTKLSFEDRPQSMGRFSRDTSLLWDSGALSGIEWGQINAAWDDAGGRADSYKVVLGSTGEVFMLEDSYYLDGIEAIDSWLDTKDFTVPKVYLTDYARWLELEFEARGTEVEVLYSNDGGLTFVSQENVSLSADWDRYRVFVDVHARKMRIRIKCSGSRDWFELRWLRVWLKPRSAR